MKRLLLANVTLLLVTACSESSTGTNASCPAETSSVTATVQVGGSIVFDWTPKCPVALLLVELDADDQWVLAAPGLSESSGEAANVILPPVTYGQAPSSAEEFDPALELVAGQSYELVLWKMLPAGSSVQCQQNFQNACLLTVKAFTR